MSCTDRSSDESYGKSGELVMEFIIMLIVIIIAVKRGE